MKYQNVLTTDEMRMLDQDTCAKKGISSLELMEQAGKKIYECFIKAYKLNKSKDIITIISGLGNNGGDSLVVGRLLIENGFFVKVVIVGDTNHLSKEARINLNRLIALKIDVFYFSHLSLLKEFDKLIYNSQFIIDGLFGIGLNRKVEGIFYDVIKKVNECSAKVFSIDIPSGIYGNNGKVENIAIKSDVTAIIQNYKIGNLMNDAKDYHGNIILLDIDILQDKITSKRYLLGDMKSLEKRRHNTHKYHYGNLITIGGSVGMTGAPLMTAYAALRTGTGISSIAIKEHLIQYFNNLHPEIMIKPYNNIDSLLKLIDKQNVIAFGPGLGRKNDENYDILNQILEWDIPLVIDADGLYYLKGLLNNISVGKKIVITPHIGEMSLLMNTDSKSVLENPTAVVKHFTDKYGFTVVLKGPCTIISNQNEMFFSNIGNPGMATAGSGDVLTGIIASLIGQGNSLINSCKKGVYIHSKAGHLAKKVFGEYSMIATDITNKIPYVLKTWNK